MVSIICHTCGMEADELGEEEADSLRMVHLTVNSEHEVEIIGNDGGDE